MSYFLSVSFMISTMLIALPSGVKVFNWLGTIWGGKLRMDSPTLFGLGFISMFIIGGLSGLLMAATPVDMVITDTYFIVAHFHYVLFGSSILGVFGAIYFWFPKMFGRMMNDFWGQVHFFLSFIFVNGTFFPMHFLGARGFLRRTADPYVVEGFRDLLPVNQFITWCAFGMAAAQVIFLINFLGSLFWGRKADANPWRANSLEWTIPNCPPHGNFASIPEVYRGPYEYSYPGHDSDYWPQSEAPA
jgi:cytochrome c oxidase subunit 1